MRVENDRPSEMDRRKRWEYEGIDFVARLSPSTTYDRISDEFSRMGNDGWELVYIDLNFGFALFKREK